MIGRPDGPDPADSADGGRRVGPERCRNGPPERRRAPERRRPSPTPASGLAACHGASEDRRADRRAAPPRTLRLNPLRQSGADRSAARRSSLRPGATPPTTAAAPERQRTGSGERWTDAPGPAARPLAPPRRERRTDRRRADRRERRRAERGAAPRSIGPRRSDGRNPGARCRRERAAPPPGGASVRGPARTADRTAPGSARAAPPPRLPAPPHPHTQYPWFSGLS